MEDKIKKLKIIQVSANSHPIKQSKEIDLKMIEDWYGITALELKKERPSLNIECWVSEKSYKKNDEKFYNGIKFRIFPATLSVRAGMEISLAMIKALKEEQKKLKDDEKLIFHFHEQHHWQVYLMLKAINKKNKNIKVICQHHGGRPPLENLKVYKKLIIGFPIFFIMQLYEKKYFKKVDLFYSLSDKESEYLRRISPNSKIKFNTMGIADEFFKKIDKKKARKKLGLDENKKYLLFIGRVSTNKGICELLEAIKEFDDKVELLIIGEEVEKEKWRSYIKKNNLNNIKFLGKIYGEEKINYLSACDSLILPSYTEGAPVVIMEAIARNLPVIASEVGGVKKMIENNREGLIIAPKSVREVKNAINEILKWKNKSISKYANKYKWNIIIKKTLEDYEKI
ncbi:MAG: glycosyltransferase family 4 protein [Candidatus Pacearchaeota archaeon]|jgi:glycosyltransferase involved in cell wall biosynthesis